MNQYRLPLLSRNTSTLVHGYCPNPNRGLSLMQRLATFLRATVQAIFYLGLLALFVLLALLAVPL